MTEMKILDLAKEAGFRAAMLDPQQIPVDGKFRAFCEENLCGQYGANYACPPDCGTVEELHAKLLAQKKVLVLQTLHEIGSYENKPAVNQARVNHNSAVLSLMDRLQEAGFFGFCAGYNGCPLCTTCKRKENMPCIHPDKQISCMSAYCIDVAKLAEKCDMQFAWTPERLHLFGMIAFH